MTPPEHPAASLRGRYDAIVVGSGPNGLAAGIELARAGCSVAIVEASSSPGGGMRSKALTLPGYVHDVCSTIHALGASSPFFRTIPLADHGLRWIFPPIPLAHPFDDGTAAYLCPAIDDTAQTIAPDDQAYQRLMAPLAARWGMVAEDLLGPLRWPRYPWAMARFGCLAIRSAADLAHRAFRGERARALFAGLAAHAVMPLERSPTAAFGLILGLLGHVAGWPVAEGGSQKLADALASYFTSLGGQLICDMRVDSLDALPQAAAYVLDVTPRQLLRLAGQRLPTGYRRQLEGYRYGPGVFKIDWALEGPIPWKDARCLQAGTMHLGGTLAEIAAAERSVWRGEHPERPFVLLAQQSLFDSTRAPTGRHTAWGYCHVPHGSTVDMTARIEAQVERFAPGFRQRILGRQTMSTEAFERYNANYIGGDINGGIQDLRQLFTRPVARLVPYSTPVKGLYLCSASTPPGGGVHGMGGYHAARAVLRHVFRRRLAQ